MKKLLRNMVIMAAVGLSVLFCSDKVEAADNNSLVSIQELKMTKVGDEQFENLQKGATKVSSKSAFLKEFQKNTVKRKKKFTITCSSWDVVDPNVYDKLDTIDSKSTSDDADFLKGGILNLGWSGYVNSSGQTVLNCKMVYTENASQVKKVNSKSKTILKKLKATKKSKMSDVAKVKVIHDYVVKLVTYDQSLKDHSAYGGLAASKHSTVCQGYALIMYKLLTDAGVPVHYVTGNAGGPHAWNIVKINGKWYYLDATWDDPGDTTVYDYFLKGSKDFKKDHTTDKYYTNKYKIASSNLNWKKLIKKSKTKEDSKVKVDQTKKEKEDAANATLRQEYINEMNRLLDEALHQEGDSDYEAQMYDLCKKIFSFIIRDMPDKTFNAFLESDEMQDDIFIQHTSDYIQEYILNPMIEYMDSDDFAEEIYTAMYNDFGEEELAGLTEEELDGLIDAYAYEIFTSILYELSEEYTDAIVAVVIDELNAMV